ncbi:MAG: helix-turn-helix domain-containing protein [Rhizobiales bacterium]|nr:helix-turn-helix domain-containing protein [Hyphomicrobiales bacterium]
MPQYLTTRELAELLRIKERKVYELAASGAIPCSKAMGKLLFPRAAVENWLAGGSAGGVGLAGDTSREPLPGVILGSHDPLLEWALRQSRSGLATYLDGSSDGLARFAAREGVAAGLHLRDAASGAWNVPAVRAACPEAPAVLVAFARRRRGLVVAETSRGRIASLADLESARVCPRQPESGAQQLLRDLLAADGLALESLELTPPARSESDAALAVLEGQADVAFGLEAIAHQYRLAFVPLIEEEFDLLVDRRSWFEAPFQSFLAFCSGSAFAARARDLAGYDTAALGRVRYNGP